MKRKKLNKETEVIVLLLCRRRCCICYGLNRDTSIKKGQIAHLDRNRNNNEHDNLVFLCLEHHDHYDTRTSQSKNLTVNEVRIFRKELHEAIEKTWKEPTRFGEASVDPEDTISGHYIRDGEFSSAELDVKRSSTDRVQVKGFALWGKTRQYGPNIGELDFEAQLTNNRIKLVHQLFNDYYDKESYILEIEFLGDSLVATERHYVIGYFGMNVSFDGEYKKAK